ncbi:MULTISPECIES: phosphodiesterase [unclassified Nocardioides]|uniref:phosphodiesterase n=1 Tax=unclassified Nocardioides TaxID=2615069 RepID=UPI0006FFB93C|nr:MULTISPECIES: phosphodiesterase [unclassified Nocardioides]KQY56882.1 3',5'-cyclic-nucleotide phosphodiesterase [Nocardioides sp. Root140]KQZ66922.1 3',5'-cyclic-nucleotide phosphodiesterase [Nocardioides sp. Root151]
MKPLGQHPAPSHVIAHLSDPQMLAGRPLYGKVDTEARLREALERLPALDPPPQAIVFTGDLADRGEPKAYAALRALVEPVAQQCGAQVIWVMGNHDERAAYAEGLLDRAPTDETQDEVHDVDGLRVISLDTSVPGYHHGEISAEQLAWLADVLATPARHGTLLALHHPPIPVPMLEAAALIELHDQAALAEVIRGTDVRGIIGGHFHYTSWSTFAGVPVSVASSTCYTEDPAAVDRLTSGVDGHQAFTMLHLYEDAVVHSVVPVPGAPEIVGHPAELAEQLEALAPEELFELVSSKESALYADGL